MHRENVIIFITLGTIYIASTLYLAYVGQYNQLPTLSLGFIAVFFSFHAYKFSKEKFRLELQSKRWELYYDLMKFCSFIQKYAGIPEHDNKNPDRNQETIDALTCASRAFRGEGYHKWRLLFGPDLDETLKDINSAYAYFYAHRKATHKDEKEEKHLDTVINLTLHGPNVFKAYLYFGDYKN